MHGTLLYTQDLADSLKKQLKSVAEQYPKDGITPHLVVVQIGDHPASNIYIRYKKIAAEKNGVKFTLLKLEGTISQKELNREISDLGGDESVHGLMVQAPLPNHLNKDDAFAQIPAIKDVDGLGVVNTGKMQIGLTDGFLPATPLGIMRILEWQKVQLSGLETVVIGRSNLVGHPTASLLSNAGATVVVCHKETKDISIHTKNADLIIAATGTGHLIQPEMVKSGAMIIDVGVSPAPDGHEKSIIGDVESTGCVAKGCTVTAVPGGVGPMTITSLLTNVIDAVAMQNNLSKVNWKI